MRTGIDSVRVKTMLAPQGPAMLVLGRSHRAERIPSGVRFKLFDQPIFTLEGNLVTLDLCGRWTPAVTRAMNEYATALGLQIKASLSKGKFTAVHNGTIHEAAFDNKIKIKV